MPMRKSEPGPRQEMLRLPPDWLTEALAQNELLRILVGMVPLEHRFDDALMHHLVNTYHKEGFDMVRSNIKYVNRRVSPRFYIPYLYRALQEDYGKRLRETEAFLRKRYREEKDLKRREEQDCKKQGVAVEQLRKKFSDLSPEERQRFIREQEDQLPEPIRQLLKNSPISPALERHIFESIQRRLIQRLEADSESVSG